MVGWHARSLGKRLVVGLLIAAFLAPKSSALAASSQSAGRWNAPRFGVTGSLLADTIVVAAGQTTPKGLYNLYIFNKWNQATAFAIHAQTPDGVKVVFDRNPVEIQAGQSAVVNATIRVEPYVMPRNYPLHFRVVAVHQPAHGDRVGIEPAIEFHTNLVVTGQTAELTVRPVLPDGRVADVFLRVLYEDPVSGRLVEVAHGRGEGTYQVPPGDLLLQAERENRVWGSLRVHVDAGEKKTVVLRVGERRVPSYLWVAVVFVVVALAVLGAARWHKRNG